jgi:glycosyltransferase involved in cell wall biosynthesis
MITFYSHNVLDDVRMLSGHLNVASGSVLERVLNLGLRFYYWGLAKMAGKIVVLDEALLVRLTKFVPVGKVVLLPISVKKRRARMSKEAAKRKLGIPVNRKVVMYFGFVSWYKGADWLIKTFERLSRKGKTDGVELVIAGGEAHSMAARSHYRNYFADLKQRVEQHPRMRMSGFVPEEEIATYMAAADVVVFPYRGLMGASGSLVHALSYGKPVLMSRKMQAMFESGDYEAAMSATGVKTGELQFGLSTHGLEKIIAVVKNITKRNKLAQFSKHLAEKRGSTMLVNRERDFLDQAVVKARKQFPIEQWIVEQLAVDKR